MPIRAVIFDLDGTITQPYFDFDVIRQEIGLPRDSGPLLESMQKMTAEQRRRAELILHRHEERAVADSTLNPGAAATLATLRERRIHVGVLTRNLRRNAIAIAEKHGLEFDAVVGREEGPVKPDAFGVLDMCATFGIEPAEAMLVGDYLFDLLCAKRAGAVAVLLANNNQSSQFAQHADFTIERLDEILDIIDGMNRQNRTNTDTC